MAEPLKVLVADDHPVVRAGLADIFRGMSDIYIVGEARDGDEAVSKAMEMKPDVILMDIFLPRCSGLQAMATIKDKLPQVRVLILTISEREEDLFQALSLGAQGYLLKSASISEVVHAVRSAAAGEVMMSPKMAARLVAEFRQKANGPRLSAREREVLYLVGEGSTNAEIAQRLFISESTARTYLRRLLDKLRLRNRAEASAYAARHSLTGTPG